MTKTNVILFIAACFLALTNSQQITYSRDISSTSRPGAYYGSTLRPGAYVASTNRPGSYVRSTARPGAYVAPKSSSNDGRYIPDDRGRYTHVSIPPVPYKHIDIPPVPPGNYSYKGGYQNKYFPTPPTTQRFTRPTFKPTKPSKPISGGALNLGPNDHLRFMIDFNFNDGGWQIVQFDWNRDDEGGRLKPKYNYVNERKIFNVEPKKLQSHLDGYFYGVGGDDRVHLDGQLNKNVVNYNFTESNPTIKLADNANIRETIGEVLEYVKKTILPSLV